MSERVVSRPTVGAKVALTVVGMLVVALVVFGLSHLLDDDPVGSIPSGVLDSVSSHGFKVDLDRAATSKRSEEAHLVLARYRQSGGEVIGVCFARVSHDGEDDALRWVVAMDGVTPKQFGQAGGADSGAGTLVVFLDADSHKMWRAISY